MAITKKQFLKDYKEIFENLFQFDLERGTNKDHFDALAQYTRGIYTDKWRETNNEYREDNEKQIYYFSMEFLPGRQLKNNLLNLGLLDIVQEALAEEGLDLDEIAHAEVDPALGNGGLGRLASCFMDSMASTGIAGHGNGIRYRYGLFKQKFVNNYQVELPENWLATGNPWEVRREEWAQTVRFGGNVNLINNKDGSISVEHTDTWNVTAVPYDTPSVGYRNGRVNTLRLWSAEIPEEDIGQYTTEVKRESVREITEVLYPDDSNYEGLLLRLKQEYFFVSAGIQSIVQYFKKTGKPWHEFSDHVQIHINDTHPAIAITELMRILLDEEGQTWEQAWEITKKTTAYTNHTILQEAMERWSEDMMRDLLPRIYQIIAEINRRHVINKTKLYTQELAERTKPIQDGQIRMANIAILGSHSVNGVARLHTQILQNNTLNDFYQIYPEKFNNKTNGITTRRWVQLSNPKLTKLVDSLIGTDWHFEPTQIRVLNAYKDDEEVLKDLAKVKKANKQRFADYIKQEMNIDLNTDAIFDVQIKRLHAYKRQLMNALHILHRYLELKENPNAYEQKRVWIFGAKAAPSYYYAKEIIKFINELADLVNNDPDIGDKMKIVFVENYGVSLAEIIIPAADISEQISLAGKEASGTSNMKLMANGAALMATLDGANVEITDYVGEENVFLFGLRSEEVDELNRAGTYSGRQEYENNPKIRRVMDALVDGTVPNIEVEGRAIYDSLINYHDEYFVLKDLPAYVEAQEKADEVYADKKRWGQMTLKGIAESGHLSSDYTIENYADDIWQIDTDHDRSIKKLS